MIPSVIIPPVIIPSVIVPASSSPARVFARGIVDQCGDPKLMIVTVVHGGYGLQEVNVTVSDTDGAPGPSVEFMIMVLKGIRAEPYLMYMVFYAAGAPIIIAREIVAVEIVTAEKPASDRIMIVIIMAFSPSDRFSRYRREAVAVRLPALVQLNAAQHLVNVVFDSAPMIAVAVVLPVSAAKSPEPFILKAHS